MALMAFRNCNIRNRYHLCRYRHLQFFLYRLVVGDNLQRRRAFSNSQGCIGNALIIQSGNHTNNIFIRRTDIVFFIMCIRRLYINIRSKLYHITHCHV